MTTKKEKNQEKTIKTLKFFAGLRYTSDPSYALYWCTLHHIDPRFALYWIIFDPAKKSKNKKSL